MSSSAGRNSGEAWISAALLRALRIAEGQGLEVLMVSYGRPSAAIRAVETEWRAQRGIA